MVGAALLAARAALHLGAGRVFVSALGAPELAFDPLMPELMLRPAPPAGRQVVLVAGCGLGTGAPSAQALQSAIEAAGASILFLPPYSPDRNPDELVGKPLKSDTVGRMAMTHKADFKAKVIASLRSLQERPDKISAFYQKPSLKYAV